MRRATPRLSRSAIVLTIWLAATALSAEQRAILKDGRELDGRFTQIPKVADDPLKNADPLALTPILLCDDELRRTMVPLARLARFEQPPVAVPEVIRIPQAVAENGQAVAGMGSILGVSKFDEYGRRILTLNTMRGPLNVIQGITEISPVYTTLRGLKASSSYVSDMRLATSSIPRDVLRKVIEQQIDRTNVDERLRLVRLLIQSERYLEAEAELKQVSADFPDEPAPKEMLPQIHQTAARLILREILARKAAGQHALAYNLLTRFPSEGVAGNLLQQVRQELEEFGKLKKERDETLERLRTLAAEIGATNLRDTYADIVKEIETELSLNNFDRLAAFRRLQSDATLSTEQKLALAISGWLLGSDHAQPNARVALSLVAIRTLVRNYLTETDAAKRDALYQQIVQQESATPELLAGMIARMKPPLDTPSPSGVDYFEIKVAGPPGTSGYSYYAVLPPQYDPYRLYPTVVTLHGAGTTPLHQLDWWAGAASPQGRLGQAARHGYIVIAPAWSEPGQQHYNASGAEHDCVLRTLRDACRRFSIDTDRVYLSGHSMGGDAAWEIGVSHPDHWAGIIPIVATTTKSTINHYTANAASLPMYFVAGELDGTRIRDNALDWDRYFVKNYDVTVVEYRGRGHEHFSDEILRIFDWMDRKRREFFAKEFAVSTRRPSDSYFWWLEIDGLDKISTPARSLQIEGSISANNTVRVKAPGAVSVWLSPELIDFTRKASVQVNGREVRQPIQPDMRVILDDVRTRGTRLHPFWAKVEAGDRK